MQLIINVVIFPRQICKFMRQTESEVFLCVENTTFYSIYLEQPVSLK